MERIDTAMENLDHRMSERHQVPMIPFENFLGELAEKPYGVLRNVFQVFHDMINTYVGKGTDEYPGDPESIQFIDYDFSRLFVKGADHPFFADRLFANRLVSLSKAMRGSSQQNKIYIFDGPPVLPS